MHNFSQHSKNYFFEIKIKQPKFDELYSKYKSLIKEDLLINKGKEVKLKNYYIVFNIPENSSKKIKKLLEEIKELPAEEADKLLKNPTNSLDKLVRIKLLENYGYKTR